MHLIILVIPGAPRSEAEIQGPRTRAHRDFDYKSIGPR